MSDQLTTLLDQWDHANKQASHWKTEEMRLRKLLFGTAFPDAKDRGTYKFRLPYEMALIGEFKLNYSVDRAALEETLKIAGDNERAVIDSVISYSPKVKEAAFEKLSVDDQKIFGEFVTIKPGAPALEIKPQSKVRW